MEQLINSRNQPIPRGLLVMAETAIPEDAAWYIAEKPSIPPGLSIRQIEDIQAVREELMKNKYLTKDEVKAIIDFQKLRERGERIQGQTNDHLRRAGLILVMKGLEVILRRRAPHGNVQWDALRMVANEPRHLVRAIPPSTSDIIMAQRLGTLAVDNAMAGHTDFMISQWLTEYVLVPLKLAVLGRKRIPESGIFWKSILAKTRQPSDLVPPWPDNWKSAEKKDFSDSEQRPEDI
jgi:6-phosphofructokinase